MHDEFDVTETEWLDERAGADAEHSEVHTAETEVAGSAAATITAAENAPEQWSQDWEEHVNRLVEQTVLERLAERLTDLDTHVERRIQSELQKRKNRADKQLAEERRTIERLAQRSGWTPEEKAKQLAAAEQEAAQYRNVWQQEEESPTPPPSPTPHAQADPFTHLVSRAELVEYLQAQGVSAGQFPVEQFVGMRRDAPGAHESFMAEVQQALAAGSSIARASQSTPKPPSEAAKVVQQFGGTAAPAQRAGAPQDSEKEIQRLLNTDPSTYDGGTMAYERRLEQLESQLRRSGKW